MQPYSHLSLEKPEEGLPDQPSLAFRRFLVLAWFLGLLASLSALWLTGTVFGDPSQLLPFWFMDGVQKNHVAILLVPLVILLVCSLALYQSTGGMLSGPARSLDERQRMIRDRAHRSAYTIIKYACMLVPLSFLLKAVLLPAHVSLFDAFWFRSPTTISYLVPLDLHPGAGLPTLRYAPPWPDNPASLAIYCGVLLLCVFLLVKVLPRSILAWSERAC